MKTEMIFVCHGGSFGRIKGTVGIIMNGHALPIAFRETKDCTAEDLGFYSLWSSLTDVEEVFVEKLRLDHCPQGPGIYHVEITFDQDDVSHSQSHSHGQSQSHSHSHSHSHGEDDDQWEHLADCHPYKVSDEDLLDAIHERNGWVHA